MSDAAKPASKKTSKPRAPAAHPSYNEMIKASIVALKDRNGSSRQAICKYIKANYKVSDTFETHVKMGLKRQVEKKVLIQPKGTGASGSFKLNKAVKEVAKPKPAAKKKPAPAKPKKPASSAKKPAAKKASAKPKTVKKPADKKKESVKKASTKKAAAKKPAAKKASTPKKTTKPAAKKPAAKKASAKPKKTTASKKK